MCCTEYWCFTLTKRKWKWRRLGLQNQFPPFVHKPVQICSHQKPSLPPLTTPSHWGGMSTLLLWTHNNDVIKWKHFPRYWSFVRGLHQSPVNSPHKSKWRGTFMFSLICVWINGWVNNREAGGFRRHRAHYDVIAMQCLSTPHTISGNTWSWKCLMGELWGIFGKYLGKIDRVTAAWNCTYFGTSHGVIFNNTRYVIIEGKGLVPISERDYSPYVSPWSGLSLVMMTSSNGNIFRGTGHLCREFTSHWWLPRTKASDAEL